MIIFWQLVTDKMNSDSCFSNISSDSSSSVLPSTGFLTDSPSSVFASNVVFGDFGGGCNIQSDCNAEPFSLSNGSIIQSIECFENTCVCRSPYNIFIRSSSSNSYSCKMGAGEPCTETIQCARGTCNSNKNTCTSSGGATL